MTVQSSIILRLIDQIPDAELRRQITAQYYQDVEAQANFVQRRVGHLEIDLREMLQQQLGGTNEMVSEVLAIGRRQEGMVTELRREFQSLAETVDGHDREIASFRQSRDQSIAERKRHAADLEAIKADSAGIHNELHHAQLERQKIAEALRRIEDMLSGASSVEGARTLIDLLHETVERVDKLVEGDQRSSEA